MDKILRNTEVYGPVTLTNNPATSFRIPMSLTASAVLQIATAGASEVLQWYTCVSTNSAAQMFRYYNAAGTAVTQTGIAADRCFEVPVALNASMYVVPVTTTADATAYITIKS